MDRTIKLADLALAERHVATGERHIQHQEQLIAKLASHGHDTELANTLLHTFLATQAEHVGHRDRLLRELKESTRPPRGRIEQRGQ